MHAHEINDPKIDPKFDIEKGYTIAHMMQEGKIKPAKALNLKETKNLYAQMTKLQSLVLQTQPLPQTIYTLTYVMDHPVISMTILCGQNRLLWHH